MSIHPLVRPLVHPLVPPSAPVPIRQEWQLEDFDFELDAHLIAQHPSSPRSASKLLDARSDPPIDCQFFQLPNLLRKGDLLIFNDTQVVKARLFGEKSTGGQVELLIERVLPNTASSAPPAPNCVVAHMRVSKKPPLGATLNMHGNFQARLLSRWPTADGPLFLLSLSDDPFVLMQKHGHLPLPPYIHHTDDEKDGVDYQTIFAKQPGAVAAPTAALHFDQSVLDALSQKGVETANITLHVGAGTFQPVKTQRIADHQMHAEWYNIPDETLKAIERCKARGSRVLAVGTTSVRTLESWARTGQQSADTNIFIRPGFQFQVVDLLLTNFHLPKSSLLMLVSAFCGFDHMKKIYQEAMNKEYRFFSYGDAMLLERVTPLESL
jgi:S-adenosylmethionine:tRNA ribosyltransferase-isomerase